MAVLKSLDVGYHKEFLPLQPSTKLPRTMPVTGQYFHCCTPQIPPHDSTLKETSLQKTKRHSAAEIFMNMRPFFRDSVTVQLLGDKCNKGQQCFKLVRDLDGEFIGTGNTRKLNKRYEQTISCNRINLTRRIFPDVSDHRPGLSRLERASPFKNMDKVVRHSIYDASLVLTHRKNFGVFSNKDFKNVNDFNSGSYEESENRTGILPVRQKTTFQNSEREFLSSRGVEFLDRVDDSTCSAVGRAIDSPFFTRDHETTCSRSHVLLSRGHTYPSMSPESICPEVIKIVPQRKEPVVRRHVTRKESKRRLGSHHVFAPPPSPAISSKYPYLSETRPGNFVKMKNLPLKV